MDCILNSLIVYSEASHWLILIQWTTESLAVSLCLNGMIQRENEDVYVLVIQGHAWYEVCQ